MKKLTLTILLTFTMTLFSAKKMIVHNSGINYEIDVLKIDSITFVENAPDGMKLIPAKDSSFTMGVSNGEYSQEVMFTYNFYMDSTEVTQKQYLELMYKSTRPWTDTNGIGDNYPAYNVSWYAAMLYCNARSKAAGRDTVYSYIKVKPNSGNPSQIRIVDVNYKSNGFRLPTEAEWEYASRGGARTDFYWDQNYNTHPLTIADSNEVDNYAVWRRNSYNKKNNSPDYGTHEVALKKPNSFGLYDMSGNLSEWCSDGYASYSNSSVVDPVNQVVHNSSRMIRGGSWKSSINSLSSGYRNSRPLPFGYNDTGFRLICRE